MIRYFSKSDSYEGAPMGEEWYEGLPDDAFKSETVKIYEKAEALIREKLAQGLDFDSACAAVIVADEELKKSIIDDLLKVLIAEEHFTKGTTLSEMAKKLGLEAGRLEKAKAEMMEDVKEASVRAFYKGLGQGNAGPSGGQN
jgi:hypothetical protein